MTLPQIIALTVALAVAALAAWWADQAALPAEEAERIVSTPPPIDWSAVSDDMDREFTITWLPLPRYPGGREGAFGERLVEEAFNVDIKPILLDEMGYSRRQPLMFAGGNIPDITWVGDPGDLKRNIYHGCVLPVPRDVIQKYAPTYYRLVSEYAPMGWLFTEQDGLNWGLPTIWQGGGVPSPGVWRKDWLEQVGIEQEPVTLDEFHEAFRRFTFEDPDGNGLQDTYGLTADTIRWNQMFSEFFGAFGVLPYDWVERDGKAVWGGITPEAKRTLAMLREWYAEGIIDPEMVTDGMGGNRRIKEKLVNGRVGYASGLGTFREFAPDNPDGLANLMAGINPDGELIPAELPVGPEGKRGVRVWGTAANIYAFGPQLAETPEKIIRVLKIFEYGLAGGIDRYLRITQGIRGEHWDFRAPDEGPSSGIRPLPPYDDSIRFQRDVLTVWAMGHPEYDLQIQPTSDRDFIESYQSTEHALEDAIGRPSLVPSAQRYLADLRNWQQTVYTEIIRGEKPLSDFDDFVAEWKRRGGDFMTREANELLETKRRLFETIDKEDSPQ